MTGYRLRAPNQLAYEVEDGGRSVVVGGDQWSRPEGEPWQRSWREGRGDGVMFVGLNMQDLTEDARAFMREFDVSYLNVRDESNCIARKWGVTGLPETFFITPEGAVVSHVIGVISEQQMRAGIAAARSGRPGGSVSGGDQRSVR